MRRIYARHITYRPYYRPTSTPGGGREDTEMTALRAFRHPVHPSPISFPTRRWSPMASSCSDGSLAGWYFAARIGKSTDAERNEVARQINAVLSRLGSGWMIQVEAVRVETSAYPSREDCHFPDAVTRAIDEERRAHFEKGRGHFESQHALILTWRPPEKTRSGLARYVYSDSESRGARYADTVLESFQTSIREVEQYLGNTLSIRRMVTQEVEERGGFRKARYDELFQFIRFCITGENHPVRLTEIPLYLDWLATAEFHHGVSPMVENRYLAVVAIDGFPAESWPGILNALDLMPITYRWSSCFMFLDDQEAARNSSAPARSGRRCVLLRSALPDAVPLCRPGRHVDGGGDRGRNRAGFFAARLLRLLHAGRRSLR